MSINKSEIALAKLMHTVAEGNLDYDLFEEALGSKNANSDRLYTIVNARQMAKKKGYTLGEQEEQRIADLATSSPAPMGFDVSFIGRGERAPRISSRNVIPEGYHIHPDHQGEVMGILQRAQREVDNLFAYCQHELDQGRINRLDAIRLVQNELERREALIRNSIGAYLERNRDEAIANVARLQREHELDYLLLQMNHETLMLWDQRGDVPDDLAVARTLVEAQERRQNEPF